MVVSAERLAAIEARLGAMRAALDRLEADVRTLRANPVGQTHASAIQTGERVPSQATRPYGASTTEGTPPGTPPLVHDGRGGAGAVERVVGRYGTIAAGALTILMGVGALVSWAVTNLTLDPRARVLLGAAGAGATAALGMVMRRRGSRPFGNTLLALSLAMFHVVAWGAGPTLHLIPPAAALLVAAATSALLAALALREGNETLFMIGFGGALAAPFVTSDGGGDPRVLLAYGLLVIAGSVLGLRGRSWGWARRLMVIGIALYAAAGAAAVPTQEHRWDEVAPGAFALLVSVVAIGASGASHAGVLVRASLLTLAGVLVFLSGVELTRVQGLSLALIGTILALVSARMGHDDSSPGETFVGSGLVPLTLLAGAVAAGAAHGSSEQWNRSIAAGWGVLALGAATLDAARRRGSHSFAAGFALLVAIVIANHDRPTAAAALLALLGAAFALGARRFAVPLALAPAASALAVASVAAADVLLRRPDFGYVPFLTVASASALAVVVAWWLFAWHASRIETGGTALIAAGVGRDLVRSLGAIASFFWVREELRQAFSRDAATFLLTVFYAAAGVAAILLGRHRGVRSARAVGLALALYAALQAMAGASAITGVALRVATYLLVGAFLLAVAYWYRATGAGGDAAERERLPEGVSP